MRKKLIAILLFQFVGLFSLINYVGSASPEPLISDSESVSSCHVIVVPSLPAENDNITIKVGGMWSNTCVPRYQSHRIERKRIWIEANTPDWPPDPENPILCAQIIIGWGFELEIGTLDTGWYQTEMNINSRPCSSRSFLVSGNRFFLTPIFN